MTRIHEIVVELTRAAICRTAPAAELFAGLTDGEWRAVFAESARQGVMSLTYGSAMRLPGELQPPFDTRMRWGVNAEHAAVKYEARMQAMRRLAGLFNAGGIKMLALKGYGLSLYYPARSQRQFGDIDIWTFGRNDEANEIVRRCGIEVNRDNYKHDTYIFEKCCIESHRHFVGVRENDINRRTEEILLTLADGAKLAENETNIYLPPEDFNALFLARHSSGHFARYSIKLRDLCDWALFLEHEINNIDTASTVAHLKECGLDTWVSVITDICRTHLGLKAALPLESRPELCGRVFEDIMTFDNPLKHNYGPVKGLFARLGTLIGRRWCYGTVVPDTYAATAAYIFRNRVVKPLMFTRKKRE